MLMILVWWTLQPNENHLLQSHVGIRPCLKTFGTGVPAPNSLDDRDPSMTQKELFCTYSLLHRSLRFCFWHWSAAMPGFSPVYLILSPLPLRLEFLNAWSIGMNLWTRLQWVIGIIPFAVMCSWWGLCPAPSSLGLVLSSASTTQAYFVLFFPILRWASPLLFIGILQGIAAGIGTSNFLRAALMLSLNSSSFGS